MIIIYFHLIVCKPRKQNFGNRSVEKSITEKLKFEKRRETLLMIPMLGWYLCFSIALGFSKSYYGDSYQQLFLEFSNFLLCSRKEVFRVYLHFIRYNFLIFLSRSFFPLIYFSQKGTESLPKLPVISVILFI